MRFVITCYLFFCFSTAVSQKYVGEILYNNQYQYVYVNCNGDDCEFAMPYVDNNKVFQINSSPLTNNKWSFTRENLTWHFTTKKESKSLTGQYTLKGTPYTITLYEQQAAVDKSMFGTYKGVYKDAANNKVIIYHTNGYLHLMSPFSEETMSLKPINSPDTFWTTSGVFWTFSETQDGKFNSLLYKNRFGQEIKLQRSVGYAVEEVWIPLKKDTLYGKLYMPNTNKKVPACLVLPGGGAVGLDNYTYEARFFAANGIASLVFDKPGNGKSKGESNFRTQTFEEKNDQYNAIFSYLQKQPQVDATKVGVHGPSEGGRLALMMAIDNPEIAFVNATAAPIMNMRESQLYAVYHFTENLGLPTSQVIEIVNIWDDYYQNIVDGAIDPSVIERANKFRNDTRLFLPPNSTTVPVSPRKENLLNDRNIIEANAINCPIFFQYGENDERVHAVKSLSNFKKYHKKPSDITVKFYNRGNHSFMTPEFKICKGYLDDKIAWLQHIEIL